MINIYQQPTEKNPTVGFIYPMFAEERTCMYNQKFSNLESANKGFKLAKHAVIIQNVEAFHRYADTCCDGQVEKESIKAIRDTNARWLTRKFNYSEFLEDVIKMANFMRALVQAMPQQKKTAGIMMAAIIIKFCKAELADEHKENPS